jgi:RecA-family ATPase
MTAPTQKLYVDSSRDASALPVTFTGNELRNKEFPPVTWGIPDLLPAGVTLFGGREKMGKTWLGFGLGTAVATGGYALGKIPVEQGDALYLSLEDPERRLYKRIRRLARQETDLARFHYATKWNAADRGGVEHLDAWLEEHPACRLVVGDTLKRIRPRTSGRRNMYDEDYEAVQPFVELAAKHNVAIVLIHHLNQQAEHHDPFDAFSGSAGLTAAADGIWLLTRKRGDADAYLMVDGRDIEEPQELALGWDAATCTWTA